MSSITKAQQWEIEHGRLIVIDLLPFPPLLTYEYVNAAIFYIMLRRPGFSKPSPISVMYMEPESVEVLEAVELMRAKHIDSGHNWLRIEWTGLYPLFVQLAKACAECSGDANDAEYLARTAYDAMRTYENRVKKMDIKGDQQ